MITSWVLVVLSFGFLVYYSHRVAKSIQNADMIGAIVDDLYVAAGSALVSGPGEGAGPLADDEAILRQAEAGATVSCAKSGYLQHVDHGALVAAAHAADALIVLKFRPGQFMLRGEALAAIVPADKAVAIQIAIDRGVHIGRHRTLTQDSEFGIAGHCSANLRSTLFYHQIRGEGSGQCPDRDNGFDSFWGFVDLRKNCDAGVT